MVIVLKSDFLALGADTQKYNGSFTLDHISSQLAKFVFLIVAICGEVLFCFLQIVISLENNDDFVSLYNIYFFLYGCAG